MTSLLARATNAAARRTPIKMATSRLDRPVASVTFDDFPKSAWTTGGPILAEHDAKGTYYAAGSFCGRTVDGVEYWDGQDLAELHAAGHEIGCHSFSHEMSHRVPSPRLLAEADRNAEALRALVGGLRLASYAFPYGEASPRSKMALARRFSTSRGIRAGVNAGRIDLAQLKAVPIEARRWRPQEIGAAIDEAVRATGWIVFFTHDVADVPTPFGCTPAMLHEVMSLLAAAGIETLPVKHAMARAVFGSDG